jgi:hypothetical protein
VAASWNLLMRLADPLDVVLLNDDFAVSPRTLGMLLAAPGDAVDVHDNWGCVLLRQATWHHLGPFDEEIAPAYWEDIDYKRRMALAGLHLAHIEDPAARHVDHGTLKGMDPTEHALLAGAHARNQLRYAAKWGGPEGSERFETPYGGPFFGSPLECRYQRLLELGGDLREHLPTLRRLACQCAHVTEFGTRWGDAATAFLLGRPKKLVSYDTARNWQVGLLESLALDAEFEFRLVETTERLAIEPTDLLFIDTDPHEYQHVRAELERAAASVRKYLVFHDTETFGQTAQDGKALGIWLAVIEQTDAGQWRVKEHYPNCHGLTVLERVDGA